MRSLIRFLLKYKTLFFFLFLEILSLVMIVNYNQFQRVHFLSSSNIVVGSLYNLTSKVSNYLSLSSVNQALVEENAELKFQNEKLNFQLDRMRYDTSYVKRNDFAEDKHFIFRTARVVHSFTNMKNNYLTIDKGECDGIQKGMGVINEKGVVGIVCDVSCHFSVVIPILNSRARINAKIAGKSNVGTVLWTGHDVRYAKLKEVPQYIPVELGDTVKSSANTAVFPEDVMIGTITEIERLNNDFYLIDVKLSVDFSNIKYVDVIEFRHKDELEQLERKEDSK
ncbi:MAG: rod shape-determining protein MreC [Paludibacteraceae bacterium]|nr:rod shape-determining protein MreC [Paludibacteraceae bacterium]MBR5973026.1 rod shape-determining protein MreC [Paludibacteraceae bacterium]